LLNKNLKTHSILVLIAEQGPKTEYDLYKQKQLAKLSRGTVHFCLNKLYQEGYLTVFSDAKENPRKKKQFKLTFRGAISYLNSLDLQPKTSTDTLILFSLQTLTEYRQTRKNEEAQHLKAHFAEFEKLVCFLENCGKTLGYPLFKEVPWLIDHFGHSVLYDILYAAEVLETVPPISLKFAFIEKKAEEVCGKLVQLKGDSLFYEEEQTGKSLNRSSEDVDDDCEFAVLGQELKKQKKRLNEMILNGKSIARADSWRQAFAANFAHKFLMSNHVPKSKGDSHNKVLRRFFAEVALSIRQAEVVPSERMADIFSD
jgi:DNA-binding PadR family transcriptional regulator